MMHAVVDDALFGGTTGLGAGFSGVIIQEAPPMTGNREVPIVRIMAAPGRACSNSGFNQRILSSESVIVSVGVIALRQRCSCAASSLSETDIPRSCYGISRKEGDLMWRFCGVR